MTRDGNNETGTEWVCGLAAESCRLPERLPLQARRQGATAAEDEQTADRQRRPWTPEPDDMRVASGAVGPAVSRADSALGSLTL
jgi:hypothetical protein